MFAIILELLGEFLLQMAVEALVELGLHSVAEPFRKQPNPWLAALGYALFGAVLGGASLLVFPANFAPGAWRIVNLALAPVAAGLAMCLIGRWRARRGQDVLRIDRFAYGYLFALSLALVRFTLAH
jgi:hypothetical protein